MEQKRNALAVLIDADNISYELVGDIFKLLAQHGDLISRRAYGMVSCFSNDKGWPRVLREYGILAKPQVSNVSGKNVADIALVIDAMELLYSNPCNGICVVSNDSDFTALAAKIREAGKLVFGCGGSKAPASFRSACTEFIQIKMPVKKAAAGKTPFAGGAPSPSVKQKREYVCPRCGVPLVETRTKSGHVCRYCEKCNGMSVRLDVLKKNISEESLVEIRKEAAAHSNAGCLCPNCGNSMTLLKVSNGKKSEEIDVCPKCSAVWYDKDEFERLMPNDGALVATVSAGKSYRRELVLTLSSDIRAGRIKVKDIGGLKSVLKHVFHTPRPDIDPVVATLVCQKVIKLAKNGQLTVVS